MRELISNVYRKNLTKELSLLRIITKTRWKDFSRQTKSKDAWKGLKHLSGFKSKSCLPEPKELKAYVNELNNFYARFDDKDLGSECEDILRVVNSSECERIVLSDDEVVRALARAKPGKASGPDRVCGRVIKSCKAELVQPLRRYYQMSLDLCCVPLQWKTSEVIPVPKAKIPLVMNDLRPVALTSVMAKCLESIVKKYLNQSRGYFGLSAICI